MTKKVLTTINGSACVLTMTNSADHTIAAWSLEIGDRIILTADLAGTVRSRVRDDRDRNDIRYSFMVIADDGSTYRLNLGRLEGVDLIGCKTTAAAPICDDCCDSIEACDLVVVEGRTFHHGCVPIHDEPIERDDLTRSWTLR